MIRDILTVFVGAVSFLVFSVSWVFIVVMIGG